MNLKPLFGKEYQTVTLDFTEKNVSLQKVNVEDTASFDAWVQAQLPEGHAGVGGWLEDRVIYRRSGLFKDGVSPRTIHLGLDVWLPAYTPVICPEKAVVHSFQNNANFGDYGPTIILFHPDNAVYTLYGHLSVGSLDGLKEGKEIDKGEEFCAIGPFPENGDWPAHLHFQVIRDLNGFRGDFPGVCTKKALKVFKKLCISPEEFLG